MGLMIYYKLDGPFELHLAGVAAYQAHAPFTLEQYRWKNRVLVVSASAPDDAELGKMQTGLTSMRKAFADRDVVLVTLLGRGGLHGRGPALTAAEVAAARRSRYRGRLFRAAADRQRRRGQARQ